MKQNQKSNAHDRDTPSKVFAAWHKQLRKSVRVDASGLIGELHGPILDKWSTPQGKRDRP